MAGQKEEIEVIINGTRANASMKEMRAAMAAMNKELRDLPKNSQEFANKKAELNKLKGEFKDLEKEIKGVKETQVDLLASFGDLIPFSGQIKTMWGNFNRWGEGVAGVTKGMRLLKVAMAATGIGALVVLLGSLVTYLTSTQAGLDKVTAVTRPLMAIFDKLKGVVQELGGSVFKGLGQIMNGDIKEGLKTLGQGSKAAMSGISSAITEGYKAGTQLDQMQKSIERTEIELIKNRARLNEEYARAKEIAEDQGRSEKERLQAAREAQKVTNELLDMEQKYLDLRIEKMELSHSLNDTSREDEKELAQLIAERTNFEAQAAERRATARSKEFTILKEIASGREKLRQEEIKKQEEENKKILAARKKLQEATLKLNQELQDTRVEQMAEGLDKELAKLALHHARQMEVLENQKNETLSNMAITEEEKISLLAAFREQQNLKEVEYKNARREAEAKAREEDLAADLERLDVEEETRRAKLDEQYLSAMMAEGNHQRALLDLEKATIEARLHLLDQAGQGESLQAQQLKNSLLANERDKNALILAEEKKLAEARRAIQEGAFEATAGFIGLSIDLVNQETQERTAAMDKRIQLLQASEEFEGQNIGRIQQLEQQREKIRREGAKRAARMQISQIIIEGIAEVASIWKGAATLGPIAGPIVGALQSALAVGRSAMAIRKISQQTFAEGGHTSALFVDGSGKLIDQTGHAVAGVVHENEWVAPAWMNESPKYANVIGWLESERTRRFAAGGYAAEAGAPPPMAESQNDISALMAEFFALRRDFQNYAYRVDHWARNLKVSNDPRDIAESLSVLNAINEDSEIR